MLYCGSVLPSCVLTVLNIIALFKTHLDEILKEIFMEIWVNDCFSTIPVVQLQIFKAVSWESLKNYKEMA
jgi:hypothetical protein